MLKLADRTIKVRL